jgi:WD40 repeat protein
MWKRVVYLPSRLSLSLGSADNSIKLWDQHKNVRTFTGHTQAVRGLAAIPDIGFASCSNDRSVGTYIVQAPVVTVRAVRFASGLWKVTSFTHCLATPSSYTVLRFSRAARSLRQAKTALFGSGEVCTTTEQPCGCR